ncbi:beta-lactamase family protein [Reichenbachiella agarivorans]|uniref:Beta-lactamase family protein n=1 Tax=Reichenbachiella agarivorans TaxID=2979464 RepID=A0ABY6CTD9_9BACT|nr:serine hydrolase domain-containing protein [Reichenbachiella agarivorans]UXP33782.1 beta-lactamase family protein [Reichenbachiella agarivorans]
MRRITFCLLLSLLSAVSYAQPIFDTHRSVDSLIYVSPNYLFVDSIALHTGIDSIVHRAISEGAFPGCQILLAQHGQVFYHQSFGYHTYDSMIAVDNAHLYDLASVTKIAATTLALMKLHDEGQLDLDQTLAYYFPYLKRSNKGDITLRKVLAHQSRIRSWIPYYEESQRRNGHYRRKTISQDSSVNYPYRIPGSDLFLHKDYYERKLKRMIKRSKLYKEEGYVYSGLAFYLFPELIERLSGQGFEEYLTANFYLPIGSTSLGFTPLHKYALDQIVPTEIDSFFRMAPLHGVVHDEGAAVMQGVSGNAGLFSNSWDLAKVMQMWLNDGVYAGQRYLSDSVIHEFTRCQYCEQGNRRGLGFDKPLIEYDQIKSSVAKDASPNSYGHSGFTGTLVWMDPDNGLLFVFLSNRVYPTRDNKKIYELNVRPDIHNLVYELLKKQKS